jgi:hypothetical protein
MKQSSSSLVSWLDRLILLCLFMLAIAAPHSIAGAQTFWLLGMAMWALRLTLRPRFYRTPVDLALLGFLLLTIISSLFSYDIGLSLGKMRAVSLFTIIYLVAENVPSRQMARLLALFLIASCWYNVLYTFGQRAVGRGLKVERVRVESPLYKAGVRDGDTLLEADGRTLRLPEDLYEVLAANGSNMQPVRVQVYRFERLPIFQVPRGHLLEGASAQEKLGIESWSRGRDWRASGFYGHYVTYADLLQLIASLLTGLFIALPRKRSLIGALLVIVLTGFCAALVLTVTRAAWLALLVSASLVILLGASRRTVLILAACAVLVVPAGLFVLQQKRNVGFLDKKDESTQWREVVWREGFQLLTSSPRHLLVGVGMDSIKTHWREWRLFDNGKLPPGHMHSNLLQIALERGVPALLLWLAFLGVYARVLWRLVRSREVAEDWVERGLSLGALGGLLGFFVSGLVHYNYGDSEVVMVFYFIMGIILVLERNVSKGDEASS